MFCVSRKGGTSSHIWKLVSDPKTKVSLFRKVEHHVVNDNPLSFSLGLCTGQPSQCTLLPPNQPRVPAADSQGHDGVRTKSGTLRTVLALFPGCPAWERGYIECMHVFTYSNKNISFLCQKPEWKAGIACRLSGTCII